MTAQTKEYLTFSTTFSTLPVVQTHSVLKYNAPPPHLCWNYFIHLFSMALCLFGMIPMTE